MSGTEGFRRKENFVEPTSMKGSMIPQMNVPKPVAPKISVFSDNDVSYHRVPNSNICFACRSRVDQAPQSPASQAPKTLD